MWLTYFRNIVFIKASLCFKECKQYYTVARYLSPGDETVARNPASEKEPGKEGLPTPSRRQHGERRRIQRRVRGGKGQLIPSRPHREKFAYVKVTVTLPPEVYGLIMKETTKRKLAKEPNPQVSAVVREALVQFFGQDA